MLKSSYMDTPLGQMLAIADEKILYLLEFVECNGLESELKKLKISTKSTITPGKNATIASIEHEIKAYFKGSLRVFKTPFQLLGTPFQKRAWEALIQIPYGETRSYLSQAQSLSQPTAYRAVANANGANQLAIVIPCHRIINNNGKLGGYGGGLERKQWLLDHEKKHLLP